MGSGVGVVAVSACMCGTRGSGVLSSTGDVIEMSVVRGVGGVCDMCMCGLGVVWVLRYNKHINSYFELELPRIDSCNAFFSL